MLFGRASLSFKDRVVALFAFIEVKRYILYFLKFISGVTPADLVIANIVTYLVSVRLSVPVFDSELV